ncbi:MAG TPA: hypothetical protein VK674_05875 [Candidatus Limnocylindria bacterium]|nr:hypothetical protein [Candidatus Limnocylindria bacterium]
MPNQNLEVVFSNQNILDTDPRTNLGNLFRYTPGRLGEFAAAAGFDGVQWMPIFDMVPGHGIGAIKRAVDARELVVNSWHQGWRHTPRSRRQDRVPGEVSNRGSWAARVAINTPGVGRVVFGPTVMGSARAIGKAQEELACSGTRDAVFYPHANPQLDNKQIAAAQPDKALIQPHDKEARRVGASTLGEFDHKMRIVRGYNGYALDTGWVHHPSTIGPQVISNIEASVPYLAPYSPEVHLSVGRLDQGRSEASMTELRGALNGNYAGDIGYMLGVVKEAGKVKRVVVETPLSSVARAIGDTSERGLQIAYQDIGNGIRNYWGQGQQPEPKAA